MRSLKGMVPWVVTMAMGAVGCANEPFDLTDDSVRFVFLAQQVAPTVVMDALFEGRVVTDAQGCLRLDSAVGATVVWPFGSRLVLEGTHLEIRNASGRRIGRVGGTFRFGGGELEALHPGLALRDGDRQLASSRCPGRYWIVGTIPT